MSKARLRTRPRKKRPFPRRTSRRCWRAAWRGCASGSRGPGQRHGPARPFRPDPKDRRPRLRARGRRSRHQGEEGRTRRMRDSFFGSRTPLPTRFRFYQRMNVRLTRRGSFLSLTGRRETVEHRAAVKRRRERRSGRGEFEGKPLRPIAGLASAQHDATWVFISSGFIHRVNDGAIWLP